MRTNQPLVFLLIISSLLALHCSMVSFHPETQVYVPLIDPDAKAEIAGQLIQTDLPGASIQWGYRLRPEWTIASQLIYLSNKPIDIDQANTPNTWSQFEAGRNWYGELSLSWNQYGDKDGIHLAAGLGQGSILSAYTGYHNYSRLLYRNLFIQPAISFNHKNWSGSFGVRASYVFHHRGEVFGSINTSDLQTIKAIEMSSPNINLSTGIQLQRSLKNLNLTAFLTNKIPTQNQDGFSRYAIGVGLNYYLGKRRDR